MSASPAVTSPAIAALDVAAAVRDRLAGSRADGAWRGTEELRGALRDLLAAATALSWIDADTFAVGDHARNLGFEWYADDARFVWADADRRVAVPVLNP
jgi:hypothetical protein